MTEVSVSRPEALSRYSEDVFRGGHTSIYGSYYCTKSQRWGFACCQKLGNPRALHPINLATGPTQAVLGNSPSAEGVRDIRSDDPELDVEYHTQEYALPVERTACSDAHQFVYFAIRHMLRAWQGLEPAESRSDGSTRLLKEFCRPGLRAQTEMDLSTLLSALRQRRLQDEDLVAKLERIFLRCQKKDYQAAQQAYMDVALGNSKWQIGGVSMYNQKKVRTVSHQDGHLLADEDMKRAMNALKRLLSFAEAQAAM